MEIIFNVDTLIWAGLILMLVVVFYKPISGFINALSVLVGRLNTIGIDTSEDRTRVILSTQHVTAEKLIKAQNEIIALEAENKVLRSFRPIVVDIEQGATPIEPEDRARLFDTDEFVGPEIVTLSGNLLAFEPGSEQFEDALESLKNGLGIPGVIQGPPPELPSDDEDEE